MNSNPDTPPNPPEPACRRGYVAAHWRGELSLPLSYWVNCVLPWILLSLALGGMMSWIGLTGDLLRAGSAAILIGWPLLLALGTWAAVGAWRAAGARLGQGGAVGWATAARVALVLGAVVTVASAGVNFVPEAPTYARLALGTDPGGNVHAVASPDGRRLQMKGTIGAGDSERVRQLMAGRPKVRLLELDSPGGRLHEAAQIADALRGRGWQTRVTGNCDNACALVFMAGASRQMMPGAQLGFNRVASRSFNPVIHWLAKREQAHIYRHAGLPESFITKMMSTPPARIWRPDFAELAAGGMISPLHRPLDVDLPAPDGEGAGDFADALSTNPTWHVLDRRFPGSIDAAAERMHAARESGASDEVVLVAGQRVVEAVLPKLLFNAGPELRAQFIALLNEQLGAVRESGAGACQGILAGDAAVRRSLPAELAVRESVWLIDAASEPVRENSARKPNSLEIEVVRRSLGEGAPMQLAGLWSPGAGRQRDCNKVAALIAAIGMLPPAERRLAIRLVFERS